MKTQKETILFDSIMRDYPISTLLVWRTKSEIRRRKFIDHYKAGLKLIDGRGERIFWEMRNAAGGMVCRQAK